MKFKVGDIIVFRNKYAQGCDLNSYNNICTLPEIMDYIQRQTFETMGVSVEHYPMFYTEQTNPFEIINFFRLS